MWWISTTINALLIIPLVLMIYFNYLFYYRLFYSNGPALGWLLIMKRDGSLQLVSEPGWSISTCILLISLPCWNIQYVPHSLKDRLIVLTKILRRNCFVSQCVLYCRWPTGLPTNSCNSRMSNFSSKWISNKNSWITWWLLWRTWIKIFRLIK